MPFILADDKNDDEGGDCSGAGMSETFEIQTFVAQGPQDTPLFTRSEPSKALLPQTTLQEHLSSVKVRLCSSGFQVYMRNLGE